VVEGARLESVYTRKGIKSSNLLLSAKYLLAMENSNDKFYVYILQSLKDFSFYVGQCDDLDRRMSKHFDGMSKYTSGKRPLRLVYFEVYGSRKEALERERQIKNKKSRKYIESLMANWKVVRVVE
jgi:putative endonuclease